MLVPYNDVKNHSATTCSTNRIIVLTEKRSTYRVENQSQKLICKTLVDGGYVVNTDERCCDYLVVDCPDKNAYLVELKGSNIRHAAKQIKEALRILKPCLVDHSCFARIVPTKVNSPDIQNDPVILSTQKLFRSLGGNLKIKAIVMVEAY